MTKSRAFLLAVLALIVAMGLSGQLALAEDNDAPTGDATAALLAGPVAFVVPPPSNGPPPSWPCVAPAAPCTTDPKGGLLMGVPLQEWPISGTTNCTMVKCGQIMAMYQSTTATGAAKATISIKQGTTTIFSGAAKCTTAVANTVGYCYLSGIQFMTTAIAGAATVTVSTTVGTTKVSGKTTIYLM